MALKLLGGQGAPAIMLAALIALAIFVYSSGLNGGFIFDDHPNLGEMGAYGGVVDYETFKSFVFHGVSSPLGRPLSLATFLLDGNNWPADPHSFKVTNLKIHLLVGLLLCWSTIHLMRLFGRDDTEAAWIALFSAGIWLLHPYMVSTTLYVVQRMAQLSALFVLAGITGYLHGRLLHLRGQLFKGYLWMTCSLVIATPLAILSKENGILLPSLILVIEFCLSKKLRPIFLWWKMLFLGLPSLIVLWILLKEINFSEDAWPTRPFTQPERLLTEARIIWEYLYYLWVPHIEGRGLYQDGYNFSRTLFAPLTTLFSIVGLSALTILAIYHRHKYSLLSISILFFLAGHLLESTTIGLELYFEHRNYLPSAFMFLPLVVAIVDLKKRFNLRVPITIAGLILMLVAFFCWQRAVMWSNTEKLQYYWAASTPESPRAQAKIAMRLFSLGRFDEGISLLDTAATRMPQSSLLSVSLLIAKVHNKSAIPKDFEIAESHMLNQAFDAQTVVGFRNLIEEVTTPAYIDLYGKSCLQLMDALDKRSKFNKVNAFKRIAPYLKASLHMALGEYELAFMEYAKAIPLHHNADASLDMVTKMAASGRPVEALKLLDIAVLEYQQQKVSTLIRTRDTYDYEFNRIRQNILEDIQALKISSSGVTVIPSGEKTNAQHNHSSEK